MLLLLLLLLLLCALPVVNSSGNSYTRVPDLNSPLSGVFGEGGRATVRNAYSSMAVGDLNGDGRPDLLVGRCTEVGAVATYQLLTEDCAEGTVDFFPRTARDPPFIQTELATRDAGCQGESDDYSCPAQAFSLTQIGGVTTTAALTDGVTTNYEMVGNKLGSGVRLGSSGDAADTQSKHTLFPCPAIADINGDGLNDVLVGSGTGQDWTKVFTYLNTGTAQVPNFAAPLTSQSDGAITRLVGAFGSCPVVIDFNGDGLLDMVVNDMGKSGGGSKDRPHSYWFPNCGTKTAPKFPTDASGSGCPTGSPGMTTCSFYEFENAQDYTEPYDEKAMSSCPLGKWLLRGMGHKKHQFAFQDLDFDGDLDLVVSRYKQRSATFTYHYFENTGGPTNMVLLECCPSTLDTTCSNNCQMRNPFATLETDSRPHLTFFDFDGDMHQELFVATTGPQLGPGFTGIPGRYYDVVCPAGTYASKGATWCTRCPAGKYDDNVAKEPGLFPKKNDKIGIATCKNCPVGKYSTQQGLTSILGCAACEPGKASLQPGSLICMDCDLGTISASSGSGQCTKCPAGHYSSEASSTKCKICDKGSRPNRNLAASRCVVCPEIVDMAENICDSGSLVLRDALNGSTWWNGTTSSLYVCPQQTCFFSRTVGGADVSRGLLSEDPNGSKDLEGSLAGYVPFCIEGTTGLYS
jgi:hypothetical protein